MGKKFSKKLRAAILSEIPGFGGYRLKISLSLTILQIIIGFRHIEDILIQNNVVPPETVYFIADIDDESEDNPVFKISLDKVPNVLEECRFFEYYICPFDLSWLICENDHDEILFIKNSK